jgi:hypothetical protein
MTQDFTHSAHHPFGPSSLDQKLTCLASYNATLGMPDTDSEDSLSGTATHALVEYCREANVPAKSQLGREIRVLDVNGFSREFLVDQARIDSAQTFIDHVNSYPGVDFNEQRVQYHRYVLSPKPGGFGTLDAARCTDERGMFADFKDGKGVQVYATGSYQLLGCALGFIEEWGHLFDWNDDTPLELWIIQPRRDWKDKWEVTVGFVKKWGEEVLKPRAALALLPDQPFTPGEKQCRFCKIKGVCGARAKQTFNAAVGQFDDVDDAVEKAAKLEATPGKLTNEQIAKILPVLGPIKKWCKDIEGHAYRELLQGRAVGDMKLVESSTDRVFVPGAAAVLEEAVLEVADSELSADEAAALLYEPRSLKSPAQVEKLLDKKRFKPAYTTPGGKEKPAGDLAHLVTKPKGRPVRAPGDDPRPKLVVDPTAGFEEVDDE